MKALSNTFKCLWCVIAVMALAVQQPQAAKPSKTSGNENGHEWVDMGTSVKWATTNVGAASPKNIGFYLAWGETSAKSEYTEGNSKTFGIDSIGNIDGNTSYDAARANWGGRWRMPTKVEYQELIDKCKWEWYGAGMKVTAKNGNVIYLPAAGWQFGSSPYNVGANGSYWSATPSGGIDAWGFIFNSAGLNIGQTNRWNGCTVRPVLE